MLFTGFMLAGFFFLFAPQCLTDKLQFTFTRFFQGPLRRFRDIALVAGKQQFPSNVVSHSEYIKLRNHLANNIQWLRQERQKVEELSGLRDRAVWKGVNFVLADIITAVTNRSRNEFIINRGKEDGLAKGQFALSQSSIIGTVSDLDSHTARVQLFTDPGSKIAAKIGESNIRCIMQGNGNSSAKIQLLTIKHKIKTGDLVYVPKKTGFLDVPMIAATVTECKIDDENPLLWDITVKPVCDIQRLDSLAVIVMNP